MWFSHSCSQKGICWMNLGSNTSFLLHLQIQSWMFCHMLAIPYRCHVDVEAHPLHGYCIVDECVEFRWRSGKNIGSIEALLCYLINTAKSFLLSIHAFNCQWLNLIYYLVVTVHIPRSPPAPQKKIFTICWMSSELLYEILMELRFAIAGLHHSILWFWCRANMRSAFSGEENGTNFIRNRSSSCSDSSTTFGIFRFSPKNERYRFVGL